MHWILFTTLLLVALVSGGTTANAVSITTFLYEEDETFFHWDFTWDGSFTTDIGPVVSPAQAAKWRPTIRIRPFDISVSPARGLDPNNYVVTITGQHMVKADPADLRPQGDLFSASFHSGRQTALPEPGVPFSLDTAPVPGTIFDSSVRHQPHVDHYEFILLWRDVLAGGQTSVDFHFRGDHIPEPSTILLFATGLLGLLGYSWRQKKRAA